jgi:hypothetical protein
MNRQVDGDPGDQRQQAFRAGQKSSTNVYLFRRLKWGWPSAPDRRKGVSGLRRMSVLDWLLLVLAGTSLGYLALTLVRL